MPRESWTDERLDDFRGEVNRRFDETNKRIDETNQKMEAGFARMDARFDAMQAELRALTRGLIQVGFILVAALIGLIATQL